MANGWNLGSGSNSYNSFDHDKAVIEGAQNRDSMRLFEKYDLNFNYSIVGMDASKVGSTVQAIEEYVQRIRNKVEQINESADMNVALKSDVIQASVKNYIEKVELYCSSLCYQLITFRDRLEGANEAWQSMAERLAGVVSKDASTVNEFHEY